MDNSNIDNMGSGGRDNDGRGNIPKLVDNFGSEASDCDCEKADSNFDPELREQCERTNNPLEYVSRIPMIDDKHFFIGEKIVTIGFANGMQVECGKITPDQLELYMKYDVPMLSFFNAQTEEHFTINFSMVAMIITVDERVIKPGAQAPLSKIMQ